MKKALFSALCLVVGTCSFESPAKALTNAERAPICQAARMANADGYSARVLLEDTMVQKGQPRYMARVLINEAKKLCPNIY